ncbi:MAG: DUF1385 domain-containing protein [Anaerolineales bacterium]
MTNAKNTTPTKLPNYGGQAVIEGVMMRGKKAAAIAMRTPEGDIKVHTEELNKIYQSRLMRIPFLRGLIGLYDAVILGMRALTISANTQTGEDEKLEGAALFWTFAFSLGRRGASGGTFAGLEGLGWKPAGRSCAPGVPDRVYVGNRANGGHQTRLPLPRR